MTGSVADVRVMKELLVTVPARTFLVNNSVTSSSNLATNFERMCSGHSLMFGLKDFQDLVSANCQSKNQGKILLTSFFFHQQKKKKYISSSILCYKC